MPCRPPGVSVRIRQHACERQLDVRRDQDVREAARALGRREPPSARGSMREVAPVAATRSEGSPSPVPDWRPPRREARRPPIRVVGGEPDGDRPAMEDSTITAGSGWACSADAIAWARGQADDRRPRPAATIIRASRRTTCLRRWRSAAGPAGPSDPSSPPARPALRRPRPSPGAGRRRSASRARAGWRTGARDRCAAASARPSPRRRPCRSARARPRRSRAPSPR